jgi:RHS repeat-associated protein
MQARKERELSPVRCVNYDANGNLTNDGNGKVYAYNAANELISVTQGGTVTGFAYDGAGRRVQETSNGALVKQWVWCSLVRPCEERDGSNNVTKRFYGHGEQIAGANYYFTTDHLGSIREMTNSAGGLVARYDYDPYGRRTLVNGTDLADFGFTGFYHDQATGLDFSATRAYVADLGRWITKDPIGEAGGINLYDYARNNPINLTDPTGLIYLIGHATNHPQGTGFPVLTDPTPFDDTALGSFSLNNLINGNINHYFDTVKEAAEIKGGPFIIGKTCHYAPAEFLADALEYLATGLTVYATASDVLIEKPVQNAVENLPVNLPSMDPRNGVDMGGGVYLQDDYRDLNNF